VTATIKRALIGVSDRTGVAGFARGLAGLGIEIVATDGTRKALAEAGIAARAVSDVTGLPEMFEGRVKTLHPAIFAGVLAKRGDPAHMEQLGEHNFPAIDLVVVNLYPFAQTRASGAGQAEIIEKIDIGGPSLLRAAAKNSASVGVVSSPAQYDGVLHELQNEGTLSEATLLRLAAEAFSHVAAYDTEVSSYLREIAGVEAMPAELTVGGERIAALRYGENPHQSGALYAVAGPPAGLARASKIQGPDLSFTNWLDVDAAWAIVGDFEQPAACVIKHTNPCGFATGADIADAYRRAYDCDPRSAFGGIVGLNRELDAAGVEALGKTFLEAVVCPSITEQAREMLAPRERLRVLVVGKPSAGPALDVRSIDGGLLVQTRDTTDMSKLTRDAVTKRVVSDEEWDDLRVAWRLCRHVKSNTIVIVKDQMAVGVGAGQMSRVEAAELAVARAAERVKGAVAASDAFFPMPDGLETLARAGVTAIVQPGGSKKDAEVTAAADELGIAMVHTGERHFRH
jgi:phosphoribosylaminoimidazolecarboxamide formyltransferase / IMP cyclohydrolase